jgi:hypothetical protein
MSKTACLLAVTIAGALVGTPLLGGHLLAADPLPAQKTVDPFVSPGVPHPATDQPFWVPTLAQAEEMARVTGRPIYVIGTVCDYWDGY